MSLLSSPIVQEDTLLRWFRLHQKSGHIQPEYAILVIFPTVVKQAYLNREAT